MCEFILILAGDDLGSSEDSGKDWSDLEREAAEEDKERGDDYREDYKNKSGRIDPRSKK